MCGGSAPNIPPPPPPQPEAPVPADDSKRVSLGKDSDKKRRSSKGYRGTILTGQQGLGATANTSNSKTLLGQ